MTDDYPEDMVEGKTDSRGRLNLGPEYSDKNVRIAVLEVEEKDE